MRIISVTSGKGGVGKTTLTANIGAALASMGQRVLLFDADLGLANLDVVLGAKPEFTLQHALGGPMTLSEVIADGPGGVKLIAGGSGIGKLMNISRKRLQEFLLQVSELDRDFDVLIFDTGAGIDRKVMTFLRASDQTLLVTSPDPASLTDAYAAAKTLFRQKPDAVIRVVVNCASDETQAMQLYNLLNSIVEKFLKKRVEYAGHVANDPGALRYCRARTPFVIGDPNLPASRDVRRLATLLANQSGLPQRDRLIDRLRSAFNIDARVAA